ncbi:MAG: hypothetical protein JWR21_937 [Herminiimonas sp.]|nr:hypothetical protein [Herminiimonas sp.]
MTDQESRKEFEVWFSGEGAGPWAVERIGGRYKYREAETAWVIWQAAWNRRAPVKESLTPHPLHIQDCMVPHSFVDGVCVACGIDEPKPRSHAEYAALAEKAGFCAAWTLLWAENFERFAALLQDANAKGVPHE